MRRIGLISTCVGGEELYSRHSSEMEQIKERLCRQRPNWDVCFFKAYQDDMPKNIDACDGYIITGSPASVNGSHVWLKQVVEFIVHAHETKKPIFGICFGHQIVAKALGGRVDHNESGWHLGISLTEFFVTLPWQLTQKKLVNLAYAHEEEVKTLPKDAQIVGHTEKCNIAAFTIGDHIFCTQGHPEMNTLFLQDVIDTLAEDKVPSIVAKAARHSMKTLEEEGESFFSRVVEFFEFPRQKGNT